jgi:hypothetical protein
MTTKILNNPSEILEVNLEEEILDMENVDSNENFIEFDEKKMNRFTCWNLEQRDFIRRWIIYYIEYCIILIFCITSYCVAKDYGLGWFIGLGVITFISCIFRLPQLIFCCCLGYPVPHFLWLEGSENKIFKYF